MGNHEEQRAGVKWGKESNHGGSGGGCRWALGRYDSLSDAIICNIYYSRPIALTKHKAVDVTLI